MHNVNYICQLFRWICTLASVDFKMLKLKHTEPHFKRNTKTKLEKEYEKKIEEQKKKILEQKISIQKLKNKINLKPKVPKDAIQRNSKEVKCQTDDINSVTKDTQTDATQCNESLKEVECQTEDTDILLKDAIQSNECSKEVESQTDDIDFVPKYTPTDATQCNESQCQTDIIGSAEKMSPTDENGAIIEELYNDNVMFDEAMINMIADDTELNDNEIKTPHTEEDDTAKKTIMEIGNDTARKTLKDFGIICELCRRSLL